jgi:hypothetical protein
MIISERQLLQLMLIAKGWLENMKAKDDYNLQGKAIAVLLDEVRNQQSDELKVIE